MKLLMVAGCVLAIACAAAHSQDVPKPEATLNIESFGGTVEDVLQAFATSAGLKFKVAGEFVDLDQPAWIRARGVTPHEGLRLLQVATGCNIAVKGGTLFVREDGDFKPLVVTRGYDVSILAGRYVDYVNQYGQSINPAEPPEEGLNYTPAEKLAMLVQSVGEKVCARPINWASAGDRILFMTDEASHGWIRQFLTLLAGDGGGAREITRREAAQLDRLAATQVTADFEEVPLASIVADFCRLADVDFVIHAFDVNLLNETHVSFAGKGTAAELLDVLFNEFLGEGWGVGTFGGSLLVHDLVDNARGNEKIFDVGALLARLDAAFKQQRTAPGKVDTYDGDLSQEGGTAVIERALGAALKQQGEDVLVRAYGMRVVAVGNARQLAAVEQILKEMGWEPPAE